MVAKNSQINLFSKNNYTAFVCGWWNWREELIRTLETSQGLLEGLQLLLPKGTRVYLLKGEMLCLFIDLDIKLGGK